MKTGSKKIKGFARISTFSISVLILFAVFCSCSESGQNGGETAEKVKNETNTAETVGSTKKDEKEVSDSDQKKNLKTPRNENSQKSSSGQGKETESSEAEENPEKESEDKEEIMQTAQTKREIKVQSTPVQFCQGKYKKRGISGMEIVTVICPSPDDKCRCEIEKGGLRESVRCGGAQKSASEESEIISCESTIIGTMEVTSIPVSE